MAIKNWNNGKPSFSYEGHANLGVNLNRQKNAPLDISCEYSSVKDMLYYVTEGRFPANGAGVSAAVKDMKKYPYLGQVIALVNPETEEVALYYVKTAEYDATLATDDAMFEHYFEAVGRATLGDNVTIVRNEETGVLSIKGYAAAETGAQLVKTANGLEWVKPDNTTVEGLNTAVAAIESTIGEDDTQGLRLRIKTNEDDIGTLDGKVATLIGEDAGKSARAISAEEVAKIVAGADKDYDTLKEIADYINSDKTGAAQMQTDISTIKSDLNAAETGLKARMTAAEGEIDALQESVAGIHSHDNKTVLDGITAEKVAAWDAAETNAKTFTTTKIGLTKEDGGDSATEAPTVKAYVDGKVTALNTAIGTQKDRIDNLGALASKSEVGETDLAAALATKINGKADSATTLAGYGIGNAYTKTEVDDAITAAKEAAATDAATKANAAEQNAKDYTDGLAGNYDAKGAADAVQKNVDKVSKAVTTVQGQVNTLNGDATTVGSVAKKIADALDGLALGDTYAPKTHNHTIAQVTGLQDALDEKAVATQVATDITAAKTAVLGEADYAHTVKDAYELANGNVSVKIAELKDIAIDEIQECIDEGNIKPEYAPYYILVYYSTQSKISESRSNLLTYCSNIVNVIEAATGITYDDNFKNVVIDFFIAFRSIENIDIDKRIEELEGIISKYKNLTVGSIEWFLIEFMKRELLGRYAGDAKYFEKMKLLVAESSPTDNIYKEFSSQV